MEILGQKFIAAVASGRLPQGGRPLHSFPERASEDLEDARRSLDSVRALDNGPLDLDPKDGSVIIDYDNSDDGGYRAHRYQASYDGSSRSGSASETRSFPATGGVGKAMSDSVWTSVTDHTATCATFLQLHGESQIAYASLSHVDTTHRDHTTAVGWPDGLKSQAVETALEWRILDHRPS